MSEGHPEASGVASRATREGGALRAPGTERGSQQSSQHSLAAQASRADSTSPLSRLLPVQVHIDPVGYWLRGRNLRVNVVCWGAGRAGRPRPATPKVMNPGFHDTGRCWKPGFMTLLADPGGA